VLVWSVSISSYFLCSIWKKCSNHREEHLAYADGCHPLLWRNTFYTDQHEQAVTKCKRAEDTSNIDSHEECQVRRKSTHARYILKLHSVLLWPRCNILCLKWWMFLYRWVPFEKGQTPTNCQHYCWKIRWLKYLMCVYMFVALFKFMSHFYVAIFKYNYCSIYATSESNTSI